MYRFIKGVGILVSRLSPNALDRTARVLAFIAFDLLRFRRTLILKNLTIAFGDSFDGGERVRVGRESIRHFMLTSLEFLAAARTDIVADTTCEGLEHVKSALEEGRGVYILMAHLGNWEALGAAGTRFAAPSNALVKEVGKGGANRLVDEIRRRSGVTPIYRKPPGSALKAIREAMKRNEIVGFMLDQARPREPQIPFFGKPARTQTSLAAIWRKRPSPVLPVRIHRLAPGRHVVLIRPALKLERTDNAEQDVLRITEAFNRTIEDMIREAPEQYFWLHNRWKE